MEKTAFRNDARSAIIISADESFDWSDTMEALEQMLKLRAKQAKLALQGKEQADVLAETVFYINRQIIALLGVYLPELEKGDRVNPNLEQFAKLEKEGSK